MQLMKLLSEDLKEAEHRITELAQKPVRERVAEALLYLQNESMKPLLHHT